MAGTDDSVLADLRSIRRRIEASELGQSSRQALAALRALNRVESCLSRPVRLAILGEQNSGKSLLVNYLLRHQILPSGGFAGEGTELLIRYAAEPSVYAVGADGLRNRLTSKAFGRLVKPEMRAGFSSPSVIYDAHSAKAPVNHLHQSPAGLVLSARAEPQSPSPRLIEIGLPLLLLRQLDIIEVRSYPQGAADNPSKRAFRHVDMTVWCTLATQAWKESEIVAWRRIPPVRRRSSLMLVTYRDAIRRSTDEAKIMARLQKASANLFDGVVLVSLRDAIQSLLASDAEEARRLHDSSNIAAAEDAMIRLIHSVQLTRFQKASRILRRAAGLASVGLAPPYSTAASVSAALDRLAAAFSGASPTFSLDYGAAG